MSFEDNKPQSEDPQVEAALRQFRESIHQWSDEEFSRNRTLSRTAPSSFGSIWQRSFHSLTRPAIASALAGILIVGGAAVPILVHHERQLAIASEARALEQARERERIATERQQIQNVSQAADAVSDENLLSHVDSDIAQATPDAMEPLARMMNDPNPR